MAETNSTPIISLKNISKTFPGVRALDDVTIKVMRGNVHGIVGENGAGKSTLMKILSGVYTKDSGTVEFDGEIVEQTTPIQSINRGLSIIYQEFNLVNSMSVGENIFLGRFKEMHGMKGIHAKARELLDSIGCKINTYTMVADLSVSQKQMVEIAKALSYNSKLIIMDEPTAALDALAEAEIYENFSELVKGKTSVYISHRLASTKFCDKIALFDQDGLKEYGSHQELMNQKGSYYEMFTIQGKYYNQGGNVNEQLQEA